MMPAAHVPAGAGARRPGRVVRDRDRGARAAPDERGGRQRRARAGRRDDRGLRRRLVRGAQRARLLAARRSRAASRCCCGSCRSATSEIGPEGREVDSEHGAVTVQNPCLSGGAIEIFLEPVLPAPRVARRGRHADRRRAAAARRRAGARRGAPPTATRRPAARRPRAGRGGPRARRARALRRGLEAGLPYVGLVASRKRGDGVIGELRGDGVARGAARAHRRARRPRHRRAHARRDRAVDPGEGGRGAARRAGRRRRPPSTRSAG